MSQPLARSLDQVGAVVEGVLVPFGGAIVTTQTRTTVEGLPVARFEDTAAKDDGCTGTNDHCAPFVLGVSTTVFCEGIPVHRGGDLRTCGHTTLSTTLKTFVGT